jgi:subtilisin family serine protease
MTLEERERIISNDYADLLVNYSGYPVVFESFTDATVQIIDFFHALVHVPVEQITDNILMERGYSIMPSLYGIISDLSLESSGITRLRSIPYFNLRGNGVLVGILDTGIDYTNQIFKYADNTTRIVSIWDQTIFSDNYPTGTYYGTEYSREQINMALASENPLEIVPSMDEIGHGTMIAGIAAGNDDPANGFYGVAPDAELVVVKLKPAKPYLKNFFRIPEAAVCYQESDILFALNYLIDVSIQLKRPLAICIALGTSQGAHDGRGTLSSFLSYQANNSGIAIVIAGGNEGNARSHFYGTINPSVGSQLVELNVGPDEQGFSMELWGSSPNIFSIDITSPSGEYVPKLSARLNENREISFIFEETTVNIDYQMVESQSGDQLILLRFRNPAQGIWRFTVYGRGDLKLDYHIWLPMSGFISDQTFFIHPNPYTTILSLGNARVPITVTAYNPHDDSLYVNASKGFTRAEVIKPEFAAPGVNIVSPTVGNGFVTASGTSLSAAHTTGVAALLLEWGVVRGNMKNMSTLTMKNLMMKGARRDMNVVYPNRDWGYGILDVFNVFDSLRRVFVPNAERGGFHDSGRKI